MARYIVSTEGKSWFVVDTLKSAIIKEYSSSDEAREVAECKNYDEEQEIFSEFG